MLVLMGCDEKSYRKSRAALGRNCPHLSLGTPRVPAENISSIVYICK